MIVTIANAKGGVAKTTSAIYLAAAYARRFEEGATVLDADPQSSASLWRDMAEENGGWPAGTDVMPANLSTLQRLARAGDAVVCKRQDIKAGMGHSPDKLHEYPQVLGEIVEAMGARA